MLNTILAVLQTSVMIVPTDQLPGNEPPRHVYLHECGHSLGAEDGVDKLIPGTVLWADPRFDCRKHKPKMKLHVIPVPTAVATKLCRAYGGDSYACQFFE